MMKFSQKSHNSNLNVKPSKKRDNSFDDFDVFGKDLKSLMDLSYNKEIPDLIFIFGYFIKNYGLLVQGIFRVSGNKTRMEEIKLNYAQKKHVEVNFDDIHNITGLYKLFLRQIPGGLIPYSQAIDLIKATKIHRKSENFDLITTELFKLPVPHYNLLKFTCSLLSHVCKCCGSNLMNAENLGTIFGPTFFSSIEDISLLPIANVASTVLIQNYNELFKVSAPVHTNLNQINENNNNINKCGGNGQSIIPSNGTKSIGSNDQNITIKFGESSLLINISNDVENSFLSNSCPEEDTLLYSDRQDPSGLSNSFISNPHFSNSLVLALKMCVKNHLFDDRCNENYCSPNTDVFNQNSLLGRVQHNGYHHGFQDMADNISSPVHYNYNNRHMTPVFEKKRNLDENSRFSLPRRSQGNIPQAYFGAYEENPNFQEIVNKPDPFSSLTKFPTHMEVVHEKPLNQVPQLDLSTLIESSEPEQNKPYSKVTIEDGNKQLNNNKYPKVNNVRQTIHENKVFETDFNLNQLKKRISALKNELRQFENSYLSSNGVKPDKSAKLSNEWYQKTLYNLKVLRQDKEHYLNSFDKTKDVETDSVKSLKKKPFTGSGDSSDQKPNVTSHLDGRLINSRPASVMSESTINKIGVNTESARSNTLNSIGTTNSVVDDLSPRECDNLRITLDQISCHLREERIRDNRPEDIDLMTQEQVECEKVTMQKALLNFECKYGRRKNPNAIQLMRPLYDRYRQVKKRLAQNVDPFVFSQKSLVPRTLENRTRSHMYPSSAWTSEKPMVPGTQQQASYFNTQQTNNIDIMMPANIPFDNSDFGDESVSLVANKPLVTQPKQSQPSNKRNSNTFQYRKKSIPNDDFHNNNDDNNNTNVPKNSKWSGEDLKSEFVKLLKDKKELQRILKDFENNFERETKRKVEKSDRLPMDREYNRYKMIKNRIKELEELFDNSMS